MSARLGSDHLIAELEDRGARCVFGLPGTQTVPLFEALRRSRVRTVLATSEIGAAFMAGGFARATGMPGICLTIPGPGFTWSLTGLAEAFLDSVPLVAITGSPPDAPAGRRFRQQELAQAAIALPLVKCVLAADSPAEVRSRMSAALDAAVAGEPGPVLLQLSRRAMTDAEVSDASHHAKAAAPDSAALARLRARVAAATRPVLFAGQGALRDAGLLMDLAQQLGAPVLTTPSARGIVPEDHALALGFDAAAGDVGAVNELLAAADLVLVIGAKLGHNGTAGFSLRFPADRLVQVDASADVLGANYPASMTLVATAADALGALVSPALSRASWSENEVSAWRRRVRSGRAHLEPTVGGSPDGTAHAFFDGLRRAVPRDGVLVLDSGLHQGLARRHFQVLRAGGMLFPSDLQSMGFGIPTAIGAALGDPKCPVVALVGDGGFTMTGFEVLTAVRERVNLVVIVFVDGELGQIRLQQLSEYGAAHAVHVGHPDLALIAAAVGAGFAEAGDDIEGQIRKALATGGVTIIEVPVGDSKVMRRAALKARVRARLRDALPAGIVARLKAAFGRRG